MSAPSPTLPYPTPFEGTKRKHKKIPNEGGKGEGGPLLPSPSLSLSQTHTEGKGSRQTIPILTQHTHIPYAEPEKKNRFCHTSHPTHYCNLFFVFSST